MGPPGLSGIIYSGDIEDFKGWLKRTLTDPPRQNAGNDELKEEITALKNEIRDLTYTVKQLTTKIEDLERISRRNRRDY